MSNLITFKYAFIVKETKKNKKEQCIKILYIYIKA